MVKIEKMSSVEDILDGIEDNRLSGSNGVLAFLLTNIKAISFVKIGQEDWAAIRAKLIECNCTAQVFRDFKKALSDVRRESFLSSPTGASRYGTDDVAMYYYPEDELGASKKICEFLAVITNDIRVEHGDSLYTISGSNSSGEEFECEIAAKDFETDKLRAILGEAAGATSPIYNRMGGHLAPAIKSLTNPERVKKVRMFRRTGWNGDKFLIPGREEEGCRIELTREVNFNLSGEGKIVDGLEALNTLILAIGSEYTLPIVASLFAPQIKRFMPSHQQRFQTAIVAPTGSFKTTWVRAAMRIFTSEDTGMFINWGKATMVGLIDSCSYASDMPLHVDNYRPDPSRRMGANQLNHLIHMVTEGGGKLRGSGSNPGTVQKTRNISSQLVITGEDWPSEGESSTARCILVYFPDQGVKTIPEGIQYAQDHGEDMAMIGWSWLEWLESEEGREKVKQVIAEHYDTQKEFWINAMNKLQEEYGRRIPVARIADNLTYVDVTIRCLKEHPEISKVMLSYSEAECEDALRMVASNLAAGTSGSNEGSRFIEKLSILMAANEVCVAPNQNTAASQMIINPGQAFIGWRISGSGDYAILPDMAIKAIREKADDDLGAVGKRSLGMKLDRLGALMTKGSGYTVQKRLGNPKTRQYVFVIKKEFLDGEV